MWLIDSLRSKRLIESRMGWSREQVCEHQARSLRDLLKHAWSNSPFYRDYYSSHGIRERDLDELSIRDLPLLNKEILMEGFDRISLDPALRREPLERWLQSDAPNPYRGRYVVVHTSGSSGNIGMFIYDKHAWTRARGLVMANSALRPRLNPFNRSRFAMCVATHGHFGAVTSAATMPRIAFDVRLCSVLDPIQKNIDLLNAFQPEQLGGYPTTLNDLAEAALAGIVPDASLRRPAAERLHSRTRQCAEAHSRDVEE